ncbi:MAG: hypothetical protein HY650_07025, partial [Acidobacteria bacterium]|nr:hypothetical protein [Acidobacteriota bacterium]
WDLPYFRSAASSAVRHAFAGWSLSGIASVGSGRPVGAEVNGLTSSTTDTDFNEDNVLFDRVPFFGRNTFTGPDRPNLDLSLRKSFQLDEKRKLEFIAQAFNVFNHPLFTTVVNTAFDARRSGGTATRVFTLTPRADFLRPTAALRGRDLQFGLKFNY